MEVLATGHRRLDQQSPDISVTQGLLRNLVNNFSSMQQQLAWQDRGSKADSSAVNIRKADYNKGYCGSLSGGGCISTKTAVEQQFV